MMYSIGPGNKKHKSSSGISLAYHEFKLFLGYLEEKGTECPDAEGTEGADNEENAGTEYQDAKDVKDTKGASSTINGIDCIFGELNCTPVSC